MMHLGVQGNSSSSLITLGVTKLQGTHERLGKRHGTISQGLHITSSVVFTRLILEISWRWVVPEPPKIYRSGVTARHMTRGRTAIGTLPIRDRHVPRPSHDIRPPTRRPFNVLDRTTVSIFETKFEVLVYEHVERFSRSTELVPFANINARRN